MENRDFFSRPIQGNGRDHHQYGNTGPITGGPNWLRVLKSCGRGDIGVALLVAVIVIVAVLL
jgi:hypothetical protein